jgi:hypothetical protein
MRFNFLFLALVVTPVLANKKPVQSCKVSFAFVYVDRLNNTNRGLKDKELKEVENKLSQYGDVCYSPDEASADYVFFVHTNPAVYHGVRTITNTHTDTNPVSGTITDQSGNTSTISGTEDTTTTTTSSVPYEVDYSVFILNVMVPHSDSAPTILRTFDQKGLYTTYYGIGFGKGKHPILTVIDAAAKWLHQNNLGK